MGQSPDPTQLCEDQYAAHTLRPYLPASYERTGHAPKSLNRSEQAFRLRQKSRVRLQALLAPKCQMRAASQRAVRLFFAGCCYIPQPLPAEPATNVSGMSCAILTFSLLIYYGTSSNAVEMKIAAGYEAPIYAPATWRFGQSGTGKTHDSTASSIQSKIRSIRRRG